jgi:acyl-CoA reductase-like NAD-dependent aldehyde dehydrogenase
MPEVRTYKYYSGGEWRAATSGRVFYVHEPFSGQLYARVAAGGRDDARIAVQAAVHAFPAWSQTTPPERATLFLTAREIVKRPRKEIAEVVARETGSTISFATFQQDFVAATLQEAAGCVYLPKGEILQTNVRRPLGVVASFTPWNGANVLSWRAVISPVTAGNTVVVKPSDLAPISAVLMCGRACHMDLPQSSERSRPSALALLRFACFSLKGCRLVSPMTTSEEGNRSCTRSRRSVSTI